ncbi:MAG: DUF6318 family protein, partial [Nocardioidaceae bacterium]
PTPLGTPTASTSITSTPSAAPSATPTAPELPAAAKGTSAASAKAFVRHWIEVLNYSGPAGDSNPLREISASDCVDCDAISDYIDKVYRSGGSIDGSGWAVRQVRVVDRPGARSLLLDVLVNVGQQEVVTAKGKPATRFKGGRRLKTFLVEQQSDGWRVARLDQST